MNIPIRVSTPRVREYNDAGLYSCNLTHASDAEKRRTRSMVDALELRPFTWKDLEGAEPSCLLEMLIFSGDDVLLAYKVEAYGAETPRDAHAQVVLEIGSMSFKVENVLHDSTHKVMVGCIRWCVLVTMAVMLTSGQVIVGPNNTVFHPRATSRVFIRKTPKEDLVSAVPRQLRSKFDMEDTFALYATVHPLFAVYNTMPVTLGTLWFFKCKTAWSGIKIAAFLFFELHENRKIIKTVVQKHPEEALTACKGKLCQKLKIVKDLLQVMADEEVFPVSSSVNRCLTDLAQTLSSEITDLNHNQIKAAVAQKIIVFTTGGKPRMLMRN
ncbi:hypothetical protein DFQ26_002273 [Actinomortierella ambigua]|nr:hypothetical protein DFQ26_002273 [Actinomortierella ambigua]